MATTYTVQVTDAEQKALEYIFQSPQQWIEQVVRERSNMAMQEIVGYQLRIAQAAGQPISGTIEDIVINADIKSAAERQAEVIVSSNNYSSINIG